MHFLPQTHFRSAVFIEAATARTHIPPCFHRAGNHDCRIPSPVIKQPQWPQRTLASVTWGVRLQEAWLRISLWRTLSAHTHCDITMIHVGPSDSPFHSIVDILSTYCGWVWARERIWIRKGYMSNPPLSSHWITPMLRSYGQRRNAKNLVTLSWRQKNAVFISWPISPK